MAESSVVLDVVVLLLSVALNHSSRLSLPPIVAMIAGSSHSLDKMFRAEPVRTPSSRGKHKFRDEDSAAEGAV
ncbi:hypothetical protein DFH94DRAFT_713015 [Russula ochroleuca]|jgi:hypothetical protein|uniref:Secreted protein n=1 Tax=Russula ochroleuca TaxID=152965 RepID=A0A9P5N5H5_9AGAM|nr:hypothetical protein DFH94DRAFT_713015 [Russula ochroleuca]